MIVDELEPQTDSTDVSAVEHFVQFYETDTFLIDAICDYIGTAIAAGDAGIVIATGQHCPGVDGRLRARGLDLAAAQAAGQYISLDAAVTLDRIMVAGTLDGNRFTEVIGSLIERAAQGGRRVHVFGAMVALLVECGDYAGAIQLEGMWNDLQHGRAFSLFCAYPMEHAGGEAITELFSEVHAAHSRVIPAESYTALPSEDARLRAVAMLQHKARWLEAEIGERLLVEERLRIALEAERAAREEAEIALQQRNEFLSIAAHELKTPLTGLSGRAQLTLRQLKRGEPIRPERVMQSLETITSQTDKLSRLLNQLLDISRLEAGKLILEPQLTDLTTLVEQAVSSTRAIADGRVINLTAPAALEAYVDPLRLEQVLTNLLDNAIKYSPESKPIDVVLALTSPALVEVSVRDRGDGIATAQHEQIFERFFQAHNNGHTSGMGLGLYISSQIAELHGGAIRVESPEGDGARFVVSLPSEAIGNRGYGGDRDRPRPPP